MDTNQTNNKEKQIAEFENLLKVYTDHSLYTYELDGNGNIVYDDNGNPILKPKLSDLPPQTRIVAESITQVQNLLGAKDQQLDERMSIVENKFDDLKADVVVKVTNNLESMARSIGDETDRAMNKEQELLDKITVEKNRIDDFFKAAEVGDIAIDTLVEIQKWIETDETDTANLLKRVGHIENDLNAEENARAAAIEFEQQRAKAEELRLADTIDKTSKSVRTECDILFNSLDAETNSRLAADSELRTKINTEIARATQKDTELEQALNTTTANLNTVIDNKFTAEQIARENSISQITASLDSINTEINRKIDTEIDKCIIADNTLRNELYTEISNHEDSITDLYQKLDEETTKAVDYTDLKVKSLENSVSNNYFTREEVSNFNVSIHSDILNEEMARVGADESLTKSIETTNQLLHEYIDNKTDELESSISVNYYKNTEIDVKTEEIYKSLGDLQTNTDNISDRVSVLEQEFIISCGNSKC